MLKIIKSDCYKVISVKSVIIIFLAILCFSIGYSCIFDVIPVSEWRTNAIEMRDLQKEALDALNQAEDGDYGGLAENCAKTIATIDYCLENDIPYNVSNVFNYLHKISSLFMILNICCIIAVSEVYNVELENNTWKNVFITGISRQKIIFGKMISSLLFALGIYVLLIICVVIVGSVRFGADISCLNYLEIQDQNIVIHSYLKEFGIRLLFGICKLVFLNLLMYCLLLLTNKTKLSVALVCASAFLSGKAYLLLHQVGKFTPFYLLGVSPDTVSAKEILFLAAEFIIYDLLLFIIIINRSRKMEV